VCLLISVTSILCIVVYNTSKLFDPRFQVIHYTAPAKAKHPPTLTSDRKPVACPTPPVAPSFVINECALCLNGGQTRSRNEGRWYNFSTSASAPLFYAYSAFYDDRPMKPVVRIGAITTRNKNDNFTLKFDCLLLFANGRMMLVSERSSSPDAIAPGFMLHGQYAKEYIYTCQLPPVKNFTANIPVGVSIRLAPNNTGQPLRMSASKTSNRFSGPKPRCFMPVEVPPKPPVRRNLAVCVKVAYGDVNPARLVEWFELQRLLGVELVGVYASEIVGQPAMDVFRRYADSDDGLVDLRSITFMGPPSGAAFNVTGRSHYRRLQSNTINDCTYRYMHSFRFIGIYDFDEVHLLVYWLCAIKSTV
jgi:hypothetical protein